MLAQKGCSIVCDSGASRLHLPGDLTPAAGPTAACIHTVLAQSSLDAVSVAHADPHGCGDGWDDPEGVQQGETQTLSCVGGCLTREARDAPERKATHGHVLEAVADA